MTTAIERLRELAKACVAASREPMTKTVLDHFGAYVRASTPEVMIALLDVVEAAGVITTDGRIGMAKVKPAALDDLQVALAALESVLSGEGRG